MAKLPTCFGAKAYQHGRMGSKVRTFFRCSSPWRFERGNPKSVTPLPLPADKTKEGREIEDRREKKKKNQTMRRRILTLPGF